MKYHIIEMCIIVSIAFREMNKWRELSPAYVYVWILCGLLVPDFE